MKFKVKVDDRYEIAKERGYNYDPETGVINPRYKNKFDINKNGYVMFAIYYNGKSKTILGHRYAWYCVYGEIPNVIDHINGDKSDNRITNLRNVDHRINNFNRKCNKKYGIVDRKSKYRVQICADNKRYHIGCYKTEEEAIIAYDNAKKLYHK